MYICLVKKIERRQIKGKKDRQTAKSERERELERESTDTHRKRERDDDKRKKIIIHVMFAHEQALNQNLKKKTYTS